MRYLLVLGSERDEIFKRQWDLCKSFDIMGKVLKSCGPVFESQS